jgi:hypothetical protein
MTVGHSHATRPDIGPNEGRDAARRAAFHSCAAQPTALVGVAEWELRSHAPAHGRHVVECET